MVNITSKNNKNESIQKDLQSIFKEPKKEKFLLIFDFCISLVNFYRYAKKLPQTALNVRAHTFKKCFDISLICFCTKKHYGHHNNHFLIFLILFSNAREIMKFLVCSSTSLATGIWYGRTRMHKAKPSLHCYEIQLWAKYKKTGMGKRGCRLSTATPD